MNDLMRHPFFGIDLDRFFDLSPRRIQASPLWAESDLEDHGDAYVLTTELVGFKPEDVNVEYTNEALTVQAKSGKREAKYNYKLPDPVDVAKATATLSLGILTVSLPKLENQRQAQKIVVKPG